MQGRRRLRHLVRPGAQPLRDRQRDPHGLGRGGQDAGVRVGARGIHVDTLSLGGTLSPWYRAAIEKRAQSAGLGYDARLAQETENVPLGKYGTPAEVVLAVETLLGPFSDHVTGTNIVHDGGFTRAY